MADTELWQANVARYHEELEHFEPEVVARALERAWRHHKVFFPSLAELLERCRITIKDLAPSRLALPEHGFGSTPEIDAARRRAAEFVRMAVQGKTMDEPTDHATAPDPEEGP